MKEIINPKVNKNTIIGIKDSLDEVDSKSKKEKEFTDILEGSHRIRTMLE